MRVMLAELPCGFMRTDPEGQVLAANPALAASLGYTGMETFPDRLDALLPLRKVAEVLPTCMYCGQVKAGARGWETAVEYLKRNALFLSHGCCPACTTRMQREMGVGDHEE